MAGRLPPIVYSLTFDSDVPASITACLMAARENARQVRDEISSEQWQQLNRLYHHGDPAKFEQADVQISLANFCLRCSMEFISFRE